MDKLAAVVLAAGKGTRMKSKIPKVLHPVGGKPMLEIILTTLREVGVDRLLVVTGYGAEQVHQAIGGDVNWVYQDKQLGTGHALARASHLLPDFCGDVLVVCGDAPLLTARSLAGLLAAHRRDGNSATVLTAHVDNPYGYGRVIRDQDGRVSKIVEEKDASPEIKQYHEVNSGSYCFSWQTVAPLLSSIKPANNQGEYYLTDIVSLLSQDGQVVGGHMLEDSAEMAGINDRGQLAKADSLLRQKINISLMESGVTIIDPGRTWIDIDVRIEPDSVVYPNTRITGATVVGEDCTIGPDTTLADAIIGNGVTIRSSVVEESKIGDHSNIGPYAYIRPGCQVGAGVRIGGFVELKKAQIGDGSKVPHLSYIGDAIIGQNCNIGCGVITVNYDGHKKHMTRIGDNAFVGSNCNLVAPILIGNGAYVAAGSTVTEDVPDQALAIARNRQTNKTDWRKD